jgi:hypothetical protein
MTHGKYYRIRAETIAVAPSDAEGRKVAITIPANAIVKIICASSDPDDTSDVLWDGKICEIFTRDLSERGDELARPPSF